MPLLLHKPHKPTQAATLLRLIDKKHLPLRRIKPHPIPQQRLEIAKFPTLIY
ncbi:MAG: hypothetical protein NTZ08_14340 [Verrucomicrobia bacterium]|nr:hypothetical protein [Verrucomicrobiota bacterium]